MQFGDGEARQRHVHATGQFTGQPLNVDDDAGGKSGLGARLEALPPGRPSVLRRNAGAYEGPFPDRLVRAGAAGYITKNTNAEELITAIRKVVAGQIYITLEIAQKMALRQVSDASKSPFAQLSERELQVMYMVTHGTKVNGIAKKLCLSPKTVNTYRYRLYEKLGVHNDVELTHLALRYGLLEEEEGYTDKSSDTPEE